MIIFLCCISSAVYFWYIWSGNLPVIDMLKEYRPPIITKVYSDNGEVIARFCDEKRIVVNLDQISQQLIMAFVAAEDSRFFEHKGVDLTSIFRALITNIIAGRIEQGGSTITQQVTKSLLLKNTKRTYRRKVREAILSFQLEKYLSKEQILFLYLNQIYLGHGAYGVEAAARTYFNKSAIELSLAEAALLAGLPQAPSRYSPVSNFELARSRQKYVLKRMFEEKYIDERILKNTIAAKLTIHSFNDDSFNKAPYFTEHIRRYLLNKFGRDLVYRGGIQVFSTVNLRLQQAGHKALNMGLSEVDKREGYRGPIRHLSPEEILTYHDTSSKKETKDLLHVGLIVEGLVDVVNDKKKEILLYIGKAKARLPLKEMKWARQPDSRVAYYNISIQKPSKVLIPGDLVLVRLKKKGSLSIDWEVSLEQKPVIQGALLCMEPHTGEVKALLGGRDYKSSQFNRAIQSRRQPGSVFKPLIYAAALDKGMSPCELLIDAPVISDKNPNNETWKPKNYTGKFFGPTLFRKAIIDSRNVITIKILKKIGVNYAVKYAHNLGIESKLSPDLSLALGSSGVSLIELTRAYAVFANGGILTKPVFIKKIMDRSGQIIEENQYSTKEVISKETAYVMTDLLKAVVQEGTGWRIKALKKPAAGKTGTTNNLWDAWFMGYTPDLVTGVWVGYDDRSAMGKGETGSRAASPIWLYFMSKALKNHSVTAFPVPKGVVFANIDAKTGLLASSYSKKTIFQAFKEGTEPKGYSPKPTSPKSEEFLKLDFGDNEKN